MMPRMSTANKIICVIPALNAQGSLKTTLAALGSLPVIVADGGSTDQTCAIAERAGARVIASTRGRGQQLTTGADTAVADGAAWLLFLHADTVLGEGWRAEVDAFVATPDNLHKAAVFQFALDENTAPTRRLERLVAWRTRVLALPYGDQGLLIPAAFYQQLGGFRPLELMEDVDMVRRIGASRLHTLKVPAMTSAAKFRRDGYMRRSARNLICLGLYFLGVPVRWIARLYG